LLIPSVIPKSDSASAADCVWRNGGLAGVLIADSCDAVLETLSPPIGDAAVAVDVPSFLLPAFHARRPSLNFGELKTSRKTCSHNRVLTVVEPVPTIAGALHPFEEVDPEGEGHILTGENRRVRAKGSSLSWGVREREEWNAVSTGVELGVGGVA
jgi:hypothetical protein